MLLYRRIMPKAVAVYMREPGLPPVLILDPDVLLDGALHAMALAVLLSWHETTRGEQAWMELDASVIEPVGSLVGEGRRVERA